jgi:hypothetical protein
MPNWCNNNISISHPDRSKMEALVVAVRAGEFCNHVCPVPEELKIVAGRVGDDADAEQKKLEEDTARNLEKYGYGNWYDFCVGEWGTKWDVDPYEGENVELDDNTIYFGFDSAWAPPIGIYEKLMEQGYTVLAQYNEPGMAFVGEWDDGADNFFEYGGETSDTVRDVIGAELDDLYGISESMAHWEEENAEDEELYTWTKEGAEVKKGANE